MEDAHQRWVMNQILNEITSGLTNCERILTTPIPVAYSIYLYPLHWSINWVDGRDLSWRSSALFYWAWKKIANEIEDPFGTDPNDLPLDQICDTILSNVEETIAFQLPYK
jgi:ion channel-forming bestrophin family protein